MSGDNQYLKIRINSIHPLEPVPFGIFVLINQKYVHYLKAGDALTLEKIESLEKKAPQAFYILEADKAAYKKYIHRSINSSQINNREKAIILRESSIALVEELFESPDIERALTESKEVITQFVEFMDQAPESMSHLISLSSHDFYTYNHSLDVSIYSLGLAYTAGYRDKDLQEMGEGALFHDIGKRQVHVDIITKDGPLDDIEWAQMQKHPQYGLIILNEHKMSDAVKACCFEHHESVAGNGYPQKLEASEIHPMARIVAITDTFDALTTKRSYNQPMTPTDALTFMKEKLSGRYDKDLLSAMFHVLFKMKKAEAKI